MSEHKIPYKTLGNHLKYLREQCNESLAEVSGAVEIDEVMLSQIEDGLERPAEEILLLLISHFEMLPHEATKLWNLAGYYGEPDLLRGSMSGDANKNVMTITVMDPRTVYTDGVEIAWNESGLSMHFSQAGKDKATVVSKVGMSYEQAERVYEALQAALMRSKYMRGPKSLPENAEEQA